MDDEKLIERIVHNYIATVFSPKMRLFKPHKVTKRNGVEYIVFDLEECDKQTMNLLFIALYDHRFSDSAYDQATALQPNRVKWHTYKDRVAKEVNNFLTETIKDMTKLPFLEIPYYKLGA